MTEWLSSGALGWLELEVLFKLILAALLGGAVGMEREIRGKAAGFRTNVLIAVGATLFTEVSALMGGDPSRIAAQVVSGCGFLGAGAVIQGRGNVTGLTTAASIWVVAAIGVAVGSGAYMAATGGAVFVLATLIFLGRFETVLTSRPRFRTLLIQTDDKETGVAHVRAVLAMRSAVAELHSADRHPKHHTLSMMYRIRANDETTRELIQTLALDPVVRSVSEG